jgi:predicted ribosome quality control (RQC) complex YloA/Tae2 family protein
MNGAKTYVKPTLVKKKKIAPAEENVAKAECNMKKMKTIEEKFNEVTKKLKKENPEEFEKFRSFIRNLPPTMDPREKLRRIADSEWMRE